MAAPAGFVATAAVLALTIPDRALVIWGFVFAGMMQLRASPDSLEARAVRFVGLSKMALYVGRVSYPLYLVHWPAGILVLALLSPFSRMNHAVFTGLYLACAIAASIAAAAVLHHAVEGPAMEWAKRKFGAPRGSAAGARPAPVEGSTA